MNLFLEKHFNILDYSLSSIWRRKLKSIGVLLVFSAVIFLIASFQMTTSGLTDLSAKILVHSPEITIQKLTAGRQESIPLDYIDKLSKVFGIQKIVPRVWGYHFDESNGANYTVLGVDPGEMPLGNRIGIAIEEGKLPKSGEAVVGQGVLESLQLGSRQIFSLFDSTLNLQTFKIAGVFKKETDVLTFDTLFLTINDSRKLFNMPPDLATDLCVYVTNPAEITNIAKKISEIIPDSRVITNQQIQKTYQAVFGWRSGFASVCLLTVLASFIIFAWDKASGMTPEERKEIGILKILGWQTADVLTLRFWEGFIVSVLSFLIGYTLAYIHVSFFSASLFRPIMMGWSVLVPTLQISPVLALDDTLLIFSLTVFPYMAATIIPAWRCAIIPPDSAMN